MRIAIIAVAALGALSLTACNKTEQAVDAKADATEAVANVEATNLENQADATKAAGEAQTDALTQDAAATNNIAGAEAKVLEEQADAVKAAGAATADAMKK